MHNAGRHSAGRGKDVIGKVEAEGTSAPRHVHQPLRQPTKWAHAAHEVTMLDGGGRISDDVISSQACGDATTNQLAVNSAHDWDDHLSQLHKASECVALV